MMMVIVPFHVDHLRTIKLQAQQLGTVDFDHLENSPYMHASEYAFSALVDGECIACAGIMEIWQGRGHAWALLGENVGKRFVRIHRAVERAIVLSGYRRIEMNVDASFVEAAKWAEMLGFNCETPNGMPGFVADARLYKLYARVK